ncbi:uncharacterized protein TNIN_134301 [Trichonephila inaurata madagascariensis]|uniref:DUF5641 domain-containing protein n=1 Tax=Trichonephila inaurata madagascariensis TaxID=2747483 RepID=A0A8X6WSH8_9ARAC|nr:uncharacterized protein TNIN_134301 [Trichonephila inaurata madagascariensis]
MPRVHFFYSFSQSFPETGDSINSLLTVRDQSGLRRVKTKIIERDDSYAFRYPILLPSRHHIVNCLIIDYHLRYSHAGIQALTVIMREEFWIIGYKSFRNSWTETRHTGQKQLLVRQRFCQELREQMWSRFRKEYLGQLIHRHGHKDCELNVGDIVLVGCENLKRVNWPIARVQELSTGRDGRVRVVKVKTRNGILTRPVRKLYPLEVCSCTRDNII